MRLQRWIATVDFTRGKVLSRVLRSDGIDPYLEPVANGSRSVGAATGHGPGLVGGPGSAIEGHRGYVVVLHHLREGRVGERWASTSQCCEGDA